MNSKKNTRARQDVGRLSRLRRWFLSLRMWQRFVAGFFSILLSIITGIAASAIYEHYFKSSETVVITFRGINAEFPANYSGAPKDAVENFNLGNIESAIIQALGCLDSMKKLEDSSGRKALLHCLLAACYTKIDSLFLAEDHLLLAYEAQKSPSTCKSLAELYLNLYLKTSDPSYLKKFWDFHLESWKLVQPHAGLLEDSLLKQSFASIPQQSPTQDSSRVFAVIVGINTYNNAIIDKLDHAIRDVRSVSNVLKKIFGNRLVKTELIGSDATKDRILQRLDQIESIISKRDRLIFYFSGHGYAAETNLMIPNDDSGNQVLTLWKRTLENSCNRYILPVDTDLENVKSTAISLYDLRRQMDSFELIDSPIIFVDACSNYPFNGHVDANRSDSLIINSGMLLTIQSHLRSLSKESVEINRSMFLSMLGRNESEYRSQTRETHFIDSIASSNFNATILVNSASIGEKSGESSELESGIFSYFLVKALWNVELVDLDNNGEISIGELLYYVQQGVTLYTKDKGYRQNISVIHD